MVVQWQNVLTEMYRIRKQTRKQRDNTCNNQAHQLTHIILKQMHMDAVKN